MWNIEDHLISSSGRLQFRAGRTGRGKAGDKDGDVGVDGIVRMGVDGIVRMGDDEGDEADEDNSTLSNSSPLSTSLSLPLLFPLSLMLLELILIATEVQFVVPICLALQLRSRILGLVQ